MESEIIQGQFYSPTKGSLDYATVIKEIFDYISAQPNFFYEIVVEAEFGTATPTFNYQFTYIHADVGEQGKTREKEVTGLIKGHGFEPMIKPYSFAASVVADRYT